MSRNGELLKQFIQEVAKPDGGLAVYGSELMDYHDIEWILVSEDFPEGSDEYMVIEYAFGGEVAMRYDSSRD